MLKLTSKPIGLTFYFFCKKGGEVELQHENAHSTPLGRNNRFHNHNTQTIKHASKFYTDRKQKQLRLNFMLIAAGNEAPVSYLINVVQQNCSFLLLVRHCSCFPLGEDRF